MHSERRSERHEGDYSRGIKLFQGLFMCLVAFCCIWLLISKISYIFEGSRMNLDLRSGVGLDLGALDVEPSDLSALDLGPLSVRGGECLNI